MLHLLRRLLPFQKGNPKPQGVAAVCKGMGRLEKCINPECQADLEPGKGPCPRCGRIGRRIIYGSGITE
jgi:hypothetical protein